MEIFVLGTKRNCSMRSCPGANGEACREPGPLRTDNRHVMSLLKTPRAAQSSTWSGGVEKWFIAEVGQVAHWFGKTLPSPVPTLVIPLEVDTQLSEKR